MEFHLSKKIPCLFEKHREHCFVLPASLRGAFLLLFTIIQIRPRERKQQSMMARMLYASLRRHHIFYGLNWLCITKKGSCHNPSWLFRKCLMQTASYIHFIILEESRLRWVIASLPVIKSSARFIFVWDFWLCTELAGWILCKWWYSKHVGKHRLMPSVRQGGRWWRTLHDPTEKCWRQKKRMHSRKQRTGSERVVLLRAGDVVYF